jgi:hypothetical protein
VFSYADLVRVEIALEVGEQFGVTVSDKEAGDWQTLGDVARSVVSHADGAATESEVFDWVRTLIVEGYGDTAAANLTADSAVFSDYDRATAWFSSTPYPHRLGDRWFANNPSSAQARGAPYYCAYNAPSDLKALPPAWRTDMVVSLARQISASLDFSALPVLADALQEAGCADAYVLYHCRDPKATHNRGCWVVDLVLREGRYRAEPGAAPDRRT